MTPGVPTNPPPLEALVGAGHATVPEVLAARAAATPDNRFLLWEGAEWTYAEGLAEIGRFSGWVLAQPEEPARDGRRRVASFLPNRPEALWAWLGTAYAGATYVPLNRAHRGAILIDMLARSRADVLVTDAEGLALFDGLETTQIRTVMLVDGAPAATRAPGIRLARWDEVELAEPARGPHAGPGDPAELMYTSGTTGRSKAVVMPHNQLCRGASWVAWSLEIGPDDVIHAWLPLFHIGGQLDMALCVIVAGGAVALQPTFSRSRFWDQVETCGATLFIGFSNVLEILWALPERPGERDSTLRAGIMGGIPPALHRPFEERFGVLLNDVYGMTEAEPLALPRPWARPPAGAAGPANPDFDVAVLDDDDVPVAAGATGQIAFRPRVPDVMLSAYEDDGDAMVAVTRNLWFHTGDLGRLDAEGNLFFLDRAKHAIRRRGENISSFELERIVLSHDAVEECCAVGVPSPLGEDDVKLVVAPAAGRTIEPAQLRAWCTEHLAAFMVPRYIDVVDRLPRGPTGKVQKQDLISNSPSVYDAELSTAR